MSESTVNSPTFAECSADVDTAVRLLELEQRLNACEHLYNEEIVELRLEVSELAANYVRDCRQQRGRTYPQRQRKTK